MKNYYVIVLLAICFMVFQACNERNEEVKIRQVVDTIGFAHLDWQMDSIMSRMGNGPDTMEYPARGSKVIISPHDDYAYVGGLYPKTLKGIEAKTLLIFGVAHKARLLDLEDQLIFDDYDYWKGPYGNIRVSGLRDEIRDLLPPAIWQVNDSMQKIEHSIEALLPFLQFYNRDIEIVPILVPYMSFEKMQEIAGYLASAIHQATGKKGLSWGNDFMIMISTDAVHYGDEDWGGSNFAQYGTDSAGYTLAMKHENEIMNAISGVLDRSKVMDFCQYTVDQDDYKKYKWTWCGRYSVPMGLLTAIELNTILQNPPLDGSIIGYATSIDHDKLPVEDLGMGTTAPANMHHWVGYAAMVYK